VRSIVRAGDEWRVQIEGSATIAADSVLLAVPARAAAPMIEPADPRLAAALRAIEYSGLTVVSLGYRTGDIGRPLDGYGYLVTRGEGLATLGVVWESSLFPGRAPEGTALLRVMLGGARRPDVASWTDEQKARTARAELAGVLDVGAEPVHQSVVTWPNAIAQYAVGHAERRAAIFEAAARLPGLAFCGTSYDGVSFTDAIESGLRAGASLASHAWEASRPELVSHAAGGR
jgi:oxygen-dependent protoporphyrinogen oxidase